MKDALGRVTWRCRDVDTCNALDDAEIVEAYDDEHAAAEYIEERYSTHEYYDRKGTIRVGVRPNNKACDTCAGYGFYDDEDTGQESCPCPHCPELVFEIEVELVAQCWASPERFDHPTRPQRCYDCGQRMDNGADHSLIRDADDRVIRVDGKWSRRCTTPPSEVYDVDASRSDRDAR